MSQKHFRICLHPPYEGLGLASCKLTLHKCLKGCRRPPNGVNSQKIGSVKTGGKPKAGNYDNLLAVALRYCPCLEFVEDGEPYVPGEESNDKLG